MRRMKVLLVEEDVVIQGVIMNYLQKYSCDVLLANNKDEAIKRYINHKIEIDIIIVDMMMSKLRGMELAVYVWKQDAYSDIRIIGVTSGYKNYLESLSAGNIGLLGEKQSNVTSFFCA